MFCTSMRFGTIGLVSPRAMERYAAFQHFPNPPVPAWSYLSGLMGEPFLGHQAPESHWAPDFQMLRTATGAAMVLTGDAFARLKEKTAELPPPLQSDPKACRNVFKEVVWDTLWVGEPVKVVA